MEWMCRHYSDLTLDQFHDIVHLREKVFVVEQSCAYQEVDGYDKTGWHLMGWQGGRLAGYARLLPPNIEYYGKIMPEDAIIGRVVSDPDLRGQGIGHDIMKRAIAALAERCGKTPITISAQERLVPFYQQHGFDSISGVYLEDGLPHIAMRRKVLP